MSERKIFYFDLPHAIKLHDMIIDISGGLPGHDPKKVQMLDATPLLTAISALASRSAPISCNSTAMITA